MPITRDQGLPVAELLCILKPSWNVRGVMTRGLAPLERHPAPLPVIVWAAIRAAQDPEILTPAVIPLNGPHWNLADRPPIPRLTPDLECPTHPGQWAGNCPSCRADTIAADRDDPWHLDDHHALTGKERFDHERAQLEQPVAVAPAEVTP